MKKITLALIAALPVVALSACASSGSPSFDTVNMAPDASISGFDKVYIAEVTIGSELASRDPSAFRTRTGREDRAVSDRDLAYKAADLHKELAREIGKTKQIVSAPGADVLTVKAEIIDIASNQPTMEDMKADSSLSMQSRYVGLSEVRVDMSNNGRILGSVTERYDGDFSQSVRSAGMWSDADRGFYVTADKVARLLNNG